MSERIYRWLLRLYPARFRGEYGDAMLQLFRDRLRAEPRLRLWADVFRDAAVSIPREYWRRPMPGATVTTGYRVPEEAIDRLVWRGHIREIPFIFLCLGAGLTIAWLGDAPQWPACAVYALLAVPVAMPLAGIRRHQHRWRNLEFLADTERIQQCERGAPTLSLERSEITRVVELPGGGMAIQTADARRSIWVPALLNGYPELRGRVSAWAPLEEEQPDRRMRNGHRAIQWLFALYPAALLVRSAAFAIPLAVFMAGYVVYFTRRFFMRRSVSRAGWLVSIILLGLLAAKVGYTLR